MTEQNKKETRKLTIGFLLGWFFGVIFLLAGISYLGTQFIPGIIMLLMGIIILPPLNGILNNKFNIQLSAGLKIFIFSICFIAFAVLVELDDDATINQNENIVATNEINDMVVEGEDSIIEQTNSEESKAITQDESINGEAVESRDENINEINDVDIEGEKQIVEEKITTSISVSQRNVVRSAENYINFQAFSKTGLINQLKFEGYNEDDAVYAVQNISVNWNQQAAKSAENYLNFMPFSRSGLIDQLKHDGFTNEQAIFGVDSVGL